MNLSSKKGRQLPALALLARQGGNPPSSDDDPDEDQKKRTPPTELPHRSVRSFPMPVLVESESIAQHESGSDPEDHLCDQRVETEKFCHRSDASGSRHGRNRSLSLRHEALLRAVGFHP